MKSVTRTSIRGPIEDFILACALTAGLAATAYAMMIEGALQ